MQAPCRIRILILSILLVNCAWLIIQNFSRKKLRTLFHGRKNRNRPKISNPTQMYIASDTECINPEKYIDSSIKITTRRLKDVNLRCLGFRFWNLDLSFSKNCCSFLFCFSTKDILLHTLVLFHKFHQYLLS